MQSCTIFLIIELLHRTKKKDKLQKLLKYDKITINFI